MRVDSANADLWIGEAGAHQHLMPAGYDPFDQAGLDLYGRTGELSFVEYIRGMRKFSGPDALAEQMGADELRIRDVLGLARP